MPSQGLGFAWKGNSSKIVPVYIDRPSHRPLKDVSVSALEHFWTRWTLLFWTILDSSKLEQSPAAICTYVRTHLNLCLFSDLTLPPTVKFITRCTISTVDKDMVKLKFFHVNFAWLLFWSVGVLVTCFVSQYHIIQIYWLDWPLQMSGMVLVLYAVHIHTRWFDTLLSTAIIPIDSHIFLYKKNISAKIKSQLIPFIKLT